MEKERKGIAFKKMDGHKKVVIYPEQFSHWIGTFPTNDKGAIELEFNTFPANKWGKFAEIGPVIPSVSLQENHRA